MSEFRETKEIIRYFLPYVNGRLLDVGAGKAKYQTILEKQVEEYVAFGKGTPRPIP